MQKGIFFLLCFSVLLFVACKKEVAVENYEYGRISVSYKSFASAPEVKVELDGTSLGTLTAGSPRPLENLFVREGKKVRLRIKKLATDSLLLDTTFLPNRENKFTLFITELLNLATFYTPLNSSVSLDSNRFQLLNNVQIQGIQRKVNFRIFAPLTTSLTAFEELPYMLKNVDYGKLSEPLDVPKSRYPTGQSQTFRRPLYVKVYDAVTDTLLVDLRTGSANGTYGRILSSGTFTSASSGGAFKIVNISTVQSGSTTAYKDPLTIYDM